MNTEKLQIIKKLFIQDAPNGNNNDDTSYNKLIYAEKQYKCIFSL